MVAVKLIRTSCPTEDFLWAMVSVCSEANLHPTLTLLEFDRVCCLYLFATTSKFLLSILPGRLVLQMFFFLVAPEHVSLHLSSCFLKLFSHLHYCTTCYINHLLDHLSMSLPLFSLRPLALVCLADCQADIAVICLFNQCRRDLRVQGKVLPCSLWYTTRPKQFSSESVQNIWRSSYRNHNVELSGTF